jgi:hypothetical protein
MLLAKVERAKTPVEMEMFSKFVTSISTPPKES